MARLTTGDSSKMEVKAPWSLSVSKWQSQVPVGIFWYVTYLRAVAFNFRTF